MDRVSFPRERVLSIQQAGLSKLCFINGSIHLSCNDREQEIQEVNLNLSTLAFHSQLKHFNLTTSVPIYVLSGSSPCDKQIIKGIIRPRVIQRPNAVAIHKKRSPEFHFIIKDKRRTFLGRSVAIEEDAIQAGMFEVQNKVPKFSPYFYVSLPKDYIPVSFKYR